MILHFRAILTPARQIMALKLRYASRAGETSVVVVTRFGPRAAQRGRERRTERARRELVEAILCGAGPAHEDEARGLEARREKARPREDARLVGSASAGAVTEPIQSPSTNS